MNEPRVRPIDPASAPEEVSDLFDKGLRSPSGRPLNIFGTLAHHPKLFRRWMVFAGHVLAKNTLSPRHRELLILRTGYRCGSHYEWSQHVQIGMASGLDRDEIDAVAAGDWDRFDELERALLQAADELHDDAAIAAGTWRTLEAALRTEQLLDVVFTVGNYHTVAFFLNTTGVELDEGIPDTFPGAAG